MPCNKLPSSSVGLTGISSMSVAWELRNAFAGAFDQGLLWGDIYAVSQGYNVIQRLDQAEGLLLLAAPSQGCCPQASVPHHTPPPLAACLSPQHGGWLPPEPEGKEKVAIFCDLVLEVPGHAFCPVPYARIHTKSMHTEGE